jgi:hypothetical protein
MIGILRLTAFVFLLGVVASICSAQTFSLENSEFAANLGPRGLVSLQNKGSGETVHLQNDEFSLEIDQDSFTSTDSTPVIKQENGVIAYYYERDGYSLKVKYELRPGWRFLTKQVQILSAKSPGFVVRKMEPIRISVREPIEKTFTPGTYLPQFGPPRKEFLSYIPTEQFGTFLRMGGSQGLMIVVQNPYLQVTQNGQDASIHYDPEMQWRSEWGTFSSDPAIIGLYHQSGTRIPSKMIYEWKVPSKEQSGKETDGADGAEVQAFTDAVRSFLLHPSSNPISVEVGWTLNDYQIDVSTAEGRAEYKRVIDTASSLGIESLLYGPANNSLALLENDADDWNWEHVLWLGLGQKIRSGEWDPEKSPIPESVAEMLDYAKLKHLGILAYVYPSLPFVQNPVWLVSDTKKKTKNSYATLASRAFQDFLIQELLAFKRRTGIAGYSFDYAFLSVPGSSSYSQWWGWRRVMESLREAEPGIVIDGRQSYQMYGPWSWLAGSYPHPTGNDEQPESFTPFPDLHFDRVSGNRARFVNYWYRNYQFTPQEVIPGYMTHQTARNANEPVTDGTNKRPSSKTVYTSFRARDWDYLGFRYSVLSSIATGGWNNVVDMIPGRDPAEFEHFSDADKSWIRSWLLWTVDNKAFLRNTKTIIGQPAIDHVDGTSAILGNRGYLFLFNPNYKALSAEFQLDSSTGLKEKDEFVLKELYPEAGKLIGQPEKGFWKYGNSASLRLDGTSATVLQLVPAAELATEILVFGTSSIDPSHPVQATFDNRILKIDRAAGEIGTQAEVSVLLPKEGQVKQLEINGKRVPYVQHGRYVSTRVKFAGTAFSRSQEVPLKAEPDGSLAGTFLVPTRVKSQLAKRHDSWPIPWTKEDYDTSWLVPERLLLFLQMAEPSDATPVKMELDGSLVRLTRAYASVREHSESFVGWYVDLSQIEPDKTHTVRLNLPKMEPGHFKGLFFDNVENEFTEQLAE